MKLFLFDYRSLLHRARASLPAIGVVLSLSFCATPQISCAMPDDAGNGNGAMQLAAKIAAFEAGREHNPQDLAAAYEKVYGKVGTVPDRWPALVRRVLVCQYMRDQICVNSSIVKLKQNGSVDALNLNHLFEVSRYGMRVEAIRKHLHNADAGDDVDLAPAAPATPSAAPAKTTKPTATVAEAMRDMAPSQIDATASTPSTAAPLPLPVSSSAALDPPPKVSVKSAAPKSLIQRASAKLSRVAAANSAGLFLDALFILAAFSLLLIYLLYRAVRGRSEERRERLRALQEIQRLEDLRDQEKIASEHDLWSERLKAEVAIEAQKAHAEDLRRLAQQAADETILSERELAATTIKAERVRYEQMLAAEKMRATEALKIEQGKTDEAVRSARFRADQAIDAYDQMAARELVYAHKHNDDLQEALNAEEARREELDLKAAEALQMVEAMKVREKKLLDIIKAEQRVRISEARQAAEKLKAAQQAAVALHQSLAKARAMKADLERRAEEAARAAELRLAEVHQQLLARTGAASMENVVPVQTVSDESDLPPATVVLKDLFSR